MRGASNTSENGGDHGPLTEHPPFLPKEEDELNPDCSSNSTSSAATRCWRRLIGWKLGRTTHTTRRRWLSRLTGGRGEKIRTKRGRATWCRQIPYSPIRWWRWWTAEPWCSRLSWIVAKETPGSSTSNHVRPTFNKYNVKRIFGRPIMSSFGMFLSWKKKNDHLPSKM